MTALLLPCTLFKTKKWMDDYSANDMRCGDLTEAQLIFQYRLGYKSYSFKPFMTNMEATVEITGG